MKDSSDLAVRLLETISFGIIAMKTNGEVITANRAALQMLGCDDLPGDRKLKNLFHAFPAVGEEIINHLENDEVPFELEPVIGNDRVFQISGDAMKQGIILSMLDITRDQDKELNSIQKIIAAQEEDKRRMAREIHDGIAPLISFAKLELEGFTDELVEFQPGVDTARVEQIQKTLDTIAEDLRNLSHQLIPRLLNEFGLYSAFTNLVSRLHSQGGPVVEFYTNLENGERVDRDIELNLFRCGQEMLQNALKHSGASEILVQLIRHRRSIILMVEDNGSGMDPTEAYNTGNGIGLANIEARARALNGKFQIDSRLNKGAMVSVEVPIS
jgi:signal transduction histidine kinase